MLPNISHDDHYAIYVSLQVENPCLHEGITSVVSGVTVNGDPRPLAGYGVNEH